MKFSTNTRQLKKVLMHLRFTEGAIGVASHNGVCRFWLLIPVSRKVAINTKCIKQTAYVKYTLHSHRYKIMSPILLNL